MLRLTVVQARDRLPRERQRQAFERAGKRQRIFFDSGLEMNTWTRSMEGS